MARLRSGHSLELGGYRRRIWLEGSGDCRRCGESVVETVEHVMQCVAGERKRAELVCSLLYAPGSAGVLALMEAGAPEALARQQQQLSQQPPSNRPPSTILPADQSPPHH